MERCRMCQNMSGLSTAEVEFRKKAGLSNESVDSSTKTVAQIIRSNVVTYYNLIFLIITILLIVVWILFGILLFTYYYCKYVDRNHPGAAFQKDSG
mgnify:CR=1 FL=1